MRGTFMFQNKNTGVSPIIIVPEIVVADKISAFKKTGMVPKTANTIIESLPKVTVLPHFKSITINFEKEEKVESIVEAAEVIIIKLITTKISTPKAFPTAMAASPLIPSNFAYTPIVLNKKIHKKIRLSRDNFIKKHGWS